jgi:hypothetical protein
MNTGGERDGKHRIGALVTVPRVKRHDDDRPSSLFRRIEGQLREPDLAPEREFGG